MRPFGSPLRPKSPTWAMPTICGGPRPISAPAMFAAVQQPRAGSPLPPGPTVLQTYPQATTQTHLNSKATNRHGDTSFEHFSTLHTPSDLSPPFPLIVPCRFAGPQSPQPSICLCGTLHSSVAACSFSERAAFTLTRSAWPPILPRLRAGQRRNAAPASRWLGGRESTGSRSKSIRAYDRK